MRPERIALFPLNVVLLPGATLLLHIFEPRYRQMVKHCLKDRREFGMLLASPDGVARVGCTAEIVKVAKRYDDERIDIVTVGRVPFRVVELFKENPLLEGEVDYLEDRENLSSPTVERELAELYEACHTLIFSSYPQNLHRDTQDVLSFIVAGTLPLDLLVKQQILECRSEMDRQERLLTYLRQWVLHLEKTNARARRAAGSQQVN
ncbi:MAG TPA: LON peptidase substrate-binding domain-containing protein [Candidatus Dormibacteraeota bacterium]|nr:LON peptidase substrate-binding domain-containing protein [Candidatus Dormibacteraeota bacterium]